MIAEDERLAREELIYLLSREEDVELLPCAENGPQLLELARLYEPQVVFLDIHMPGPDGMKIAGELLKSDRPPYMVFATAFEQYAVEAFKLEAVDYLLKPYDENRIRQTLQRIRQKLGSEAPYQMTAISKAPAAGLKTKLIIDTGDRMIVVDPSAVAFAEKEEKWTRIHMTEGQVHETRQTLQELEERLANPTFFRTHRSYLVNIESIDEMEPWFNGAYNLILKDAKRSRIPLSRGAAKELMNRLQGI